MANPVNLMPYTLEHLQKCIANKLLKETIQSLVERFAAAPGDFDGIPPDDKQVRDFALAYWDASDFDRTVRNLLRTMEMKERK